MAETDTIIETPAAPEPAKPKRKWTSHKKGGWPKGKPRGPRAEPEPQPVPLARGQELAGITPDHCPRACNAQRCAISGRAYCAHPHKGGLQMISMHDGEALARLNAAKKMLGKQKVEVRYA